MADINLLQTPTSQTSTISSRSRVLLARVLMLVLVLIVAFYAWLQYDHWRTGKNIAATQASIATAQADALNNKARAEVVTRQGQLEELDSLLEDHMYWSYLLPELARVTLVSAKYTSIEANSAGTLTMSVTLPSYQDLEKYLQIFDLPEYNKEFSNVKILSINQTQVNNTLGTVVKLELTFNPKYLKGRM
jgi:hypothetical protein